DLVADDLGARPEGPEETVLVVRRPAPQNHGVDRQAADREDEENADIHVRRDDEAKALGIGSAHGSGSERHDHESEHGGEYGDRRRDEVERLVDVVGNHLLLEEKLEPIRERLTQSPEAKAAEHFLEFRLAQVKTHAVGSETILHPRGYLAFEENEVRAGGEQAAHYDKDDQQGEEQF